MDTQTNVLLTEDDTFRILARPPFDRMREIHRLWKTQGHRVSYENVAFMRRHGWTWLEYVNERSDRGYAD
jgi:hypothetical protein